MESGVQPAAGGGRVASLHLHPSAPGEPMADVLFMDLVQDRGIAGNKRYYDRRSRSTGLPGQRQVSLIERETVSEHAAALFLNRIDPGRVRSNIETTGIDLISLIGRTVRIGEAVLLIREARTPCAKMDCLEPGLRRLMENDRQGVLAQVVQSGRVAVDDPILPVTLEPASPGEPLL